MLRGRFVFPLILIALVAFTVCYIGYRTYDESVKADDLLSVATEFTHSLEHKETHVHVHPSGEHSHSQTGQIESNSESSKRGYPNPSGAPAFEYVYMIDGVPLYTETPLSQEDIERETWIRTGKTTPYMEQYLKELQEYNPYRSTVLQRIVTPDGQLHTVAVPNDWQYEEGDAILRSELDPRALGTTESLGGASLMIKGVKYSLPEEYYAIEDRYEREEYFNKFYATKRLGISMEEVEKKVAAGEINVSLSEADKHRIKQNEEQEERMKMLSFQLPPMLDRPPVKVSFLPEDGENTRPGWMLKQELNAWQPILAEYGGEIVDEGSINENASGAPVRSGVPVSPSDLPNMVKPTPSSPSVSDLEKQLTPEGIEAELSEGLSLERFDKAQQLIEQYGTEEGLRRLREMDPEAARRFESYKSRPGREQRNPPTRDTSEDAAPTQ